MEEFTKKDVMANCDLTARQFQFYVDQGLVHPSDKYSKGGVKANRFEFLTSSNNPGRGVPRVYNKTNLMEFHIISRLSRRGVSVGKIAGILDFMRSVDIKPLENRRDYYGKKGRGYLIVYVDRQTKKDMVDFKFTMGNETCVLTEADLSRFVDPIVLNYGDLCEQVEKL